VCLAEVLDGCSVTWAVSRLSRRSYDQVRSLAYKSQAYLVLLVAGLACREGMDVSPCMALAVFRDRFGPADDDEFSFLADD